MKFAFSAPTRDDGQTRELFEGFHATGYEGLQLKPGQYAKYLDQPQRLLEQWPQLQGAVSGLITGAGLDEAGRHKLRQVFRFAGAAGAELVIFCHGQKRDGLSDEDLRGFADALDELGREARDAGTHLSLHHHFDQPCMHRRDFDIFFDKPRSYGLTIDTAHLVKSGVTDIAEVIRSFRSAIDNFHMKDFAGGAFQVLGEGGIDFAPVFAAVREIGYDGWIAADEESGGDLSGGMAACLEFLRQI